MGRLIEMLSASHTSDIHTVVADLIKGIISMSAPSPGAGLTEGLQNGPASNRFARELALPSNISKLVDYMLHDFGQNDDDDSPHDSQTPSGTEAFATYGYTDEPLPNLQSYTSSVVHSISVVIELIRKNNSDYFEPYLFHTLRNRLITLQQQLQSDDRQTLERAMKEMVDRMCVVNLGSVLEIMCDRLESFQRYLRKPRSMVSQQIILVGFSDKYCAFQSGPISTTVGVITPLTLERYRICELLAELIHCSNMALLNRSAEFNRLYDSDGRLQGGLSALEELACVIAVGSGGDEREQDNMDEAADEIEPALQLPVTTGSRDSPSLLDSDEEMSDGDEPGSSDDETMEEILMTEEPASSEQQQPTVVVPSSPNAIRLSSPISSAPHPVLSNRRSGSLNSDSDGSTVGQRSQNSRRNSRRTFTLEKSVDEPMPIGERLKRRFLDLNLLSTILVSVFP
jgi:serine/threonine-protein phosphatase 6 regulatory subunit 3